MKNILTLEVLGGRQEGNGLGLGLEGGDRRLFGRGGEAKGGRKDAENDGGTEHFLF